MSTLNYILISSIIIGFGTYGVANTIALHSGPYEIFDRLREKLISDLPEDTTKFSRTTKGTIYNILTCVYCLGVWVAMAAGLLSLLIHPDEPTPLYIPAWFLMVAAGLGVQHLLISVESDD